MVTVFFNLIELNSIVLESGAFWSMGSSAVVIGLVLLVLALLYRLRQSHAKLQRAEAAPSSPADHLERDLFERLSVVASEMVDAVIIFNGNGDIEWANKGFIKMTGLTTEEYIQKEGGNLYDISDAPNIDQLKARTIDPEFLKYDFNHTDAKGVERWYACTLTPIKGDDGEYIKFISIYADITKRKRFEQELRQQNKNMTDSIRYAKNIQEAILPDRTLLFKNFEAFIMHKPRDIVSGDFYWFNKVGKVFVIAAADCTGHGVPGAMMSMMGNEFLHQIVNNSSITGPEQALIRLDTMFKRALHQDGVDKESKDGMDIAMAAIHTDNLWCQFAGANNPLYLLRDGELTFYDPAKESIGGYSENEKAFFSHEFDLKSGDLLYLFSDGYVDQFGGPKGRKFMRKRFRELLLSIASEPMAIQHLKVEKAYVEWRGDEQQVDDVLVIGLRIP